MLKGETKISTYQRGVHVQTAITRMTTDIVITKVESLTLTLDRIEAHISLPNNSSPLHPSLWGSSKRLRRPTNSSPTCHVQPNSFVTLRQLLSSVFATAVGSHLLGFSTHPYSAASSNSGSAARPLLNLDVSYPKYPDCLHPLEGEGGDFSPVVSLSPSVAWVGERLSVEEQEQEQERT